mmetsp:Transcript_37419/g.78926  ORF Transcript_37419/g.78926 Transcript_37419/m.78926 type:complete len:110 (-) Transcript_37419:159-488(-)
MGMNMNIKNQGQPTKATTFGKPSRWSEVMHERTGTEENNDGRSEFKRCLGPVFQHCDMILENEQLTPSMQMEISGTGCLHYYVHISTQAGDCEFQLSFGRSRGTSPKTT